MIAYILERLYLGLCVIAPVKVLKMNISDYSHPKEMYFVYLQSKLFLEVQIYLKKSPKIIVRYLLKTNRRIIIATCVTGCR